MSRTKQNTTVFALLACSFLLIAAIGCNPGSVMAPAEVPSGEVVTNPNFIRILSTSDGPSMVSGAAQIVSATEGGTVTNGRVTLIFPAGALNEDTEITIDMAEDNILGVELGPHGIQFNEPVTLRFDLTGTSAEGRGDEAGTLWYNEELNQWERVEKGNSGDANHTEAILEHFSRYGNDIGG